MCIVKTNHQYPTHKTQTYTGLGKRVRDQEFSRIFKMCKVHVSQKLGVQKRLRRQGIESENVRSFGKYTINTSRVSCTRGLLTAGKGETE